MSAETRRPTIRSMIAIIGLLAGGLVMQNQMFADAAGTPANKVAAAGSDIDTVGAGGTELVMSEIMKVSTTRDLMLHLSAECSILTRLNTTGGEQTQSETDFAFGQVKLYIAIDGKRVPVTTDGTDTAASATDEDGSDLGEVVFCNRAYQRTVTDSEENENLLTGNQNGDGIDGENDYIRTRSANAFTWLALDAGRIYDDPANGNNIIQVDVFAEYDTRATDSAATAPLTPSCVNARGEDAVPLTPGGPTCADAFIGSRTLVVDTDVASNREGISQGDGDAYPSRS